MDDLHALKQAAADAWEVYEAKRDEWQSSAPGYPRIYRHDERRNSLQRRLGCVREGGQGEQPAAAKGGRMIEFILIVGFIIGVVIGWILISFILAVLEELLF